MCWRFAPVDQGRWPTHLRVPASRISSSVARCMRPTFTWSFSDSLVSASAFLRGPSLTYPRFGGLSTAMNMRRTPVSLGADICRANHAGTWQNIGAPVCERTKALCLHLALRRCAAMPLVYLQVMKKSTPMGNSFANFFPHAVIWRYCRSRLTLPRRVYPKFGEGGILAGE